MNREYLIRRIPDLAFAALLGAGLWLGGGGALAGLPRFVQAALPGMAAEASVAEDAPRLSTRVARFSLPGFGESRYAPQVLYPVATGGMPNWLVQAVRAARLGPPPALRGVPAGVAVTRPVIAICIDDLGEDLAGTDKAMALPKEVALSFLPYAESTPFLADAAARQGHPILAHVPMQALNGSDPGPMALKPGMSEGEISRRLVWNLSRVPHLSGVNNHEGSLFTSNAQALEPVMAMLKARGLFFLDSRTAGSSVAEAVARAAGVDTGGRDIFLDDDQRPMAVAAQLDALVHEARRTGAAIAIGHPHDVTLKLLVEWLAQDHGVRLVPLDEAMRIKRERAMVAVR